jgi:L-iditol 2-dehydrogenase
VKAALLTGIRKIEIRDIPEPKIEGNNNVLLKVGAIGVCGSDVHYFSHGKIGNQVVEYPFMVGHEFGATVLKTGRDVHSLQPGDKVAVDPAMSCGSCDQCLSGRRHTCRRLRFLGCPGQAPGCLCELAVMPQACCWKVNKDTTLEQAALVEPLSIGFYSVELAKSMPGARIGILGCGPIGLSVLLAAKAGGVNEIFATDKIDQRLQIAHRAGATWTGNPKKENVIDGINRLNPALLDMVFECCGSQEALDQAVRLVKPGGKLMLIGIPAESRISFPIEELRHREICIQNVRRQNGCVPAAVQLIETGKVTTDFMITHHFPLKNALEAFELVEHYRDGVMKAIIEVDETTGTSP